MSMLGRVGWEDERRSGSSSGHAQSSASEAVIEMESSAVTSSSDPPKETMPLTSMKKWNTPVNWGAAGRVKAWHHSEICLEICSFSICSFRLPDARRGRRQVNLRCRELVYGKLLNSRASVSFCIRFSLWPLASARRCFHHCRRKNLMNGALSQPYSGCILPFLWVEVPFVCAGTRTWTNQASVSE